MPELNTVDPSQLPLHADKHEAGGTDAMDPQTPAAHVHIIADVTGLQTALDGKAAAVHTHDHGGLDGLADDDHPQYLRVDGTRALTGDLSAGGNKITNLGTPSAAGDAAPKSYVDNAIAGLSWKASVRAASDGPVTLATDVEAGDTLDGVTLVAGDRILLKDQAAGAENGIYVVSASGAPARADDANTAAELLGAAVYVREGTEHADTQWILTTDAPITLGTTGLTWTQLTTGGGGALADLSDVDLTGQADDDFLQRVSGVWKPVAGLLVPAWLGVARVTGHPDEPPASPHACDDEFTAGSLDPKWTLSGGAGSSFRNSCVILSVPSASAAAIHQSYVPGAGVAFTVRAKFAAWSYREDIDYAGIGIHDSSGVNIANCELRRWGGWLFYRDGPGGSGNVSTDPFGQGPFYLEIKRDASNNYTLGLSFDGLQFSTYGLAGSSSATAVGRIHVRVGQTAATTWKYGAIDWVRVTEP